MVWPPSFALARAFVDQARANRRALCRLAHLGMRAGPDDGGTRVRRRPPYGVVAARDESLDSDLRARAIGSRFVG